MQRQRTSFQEGSVAAEVTGRGNDECLCQTKKQENFGTKWLVR